MRPVILLCPCACTRACVSVDLQPSQVCHMTHMVLRPQLLIRSFFFLHWSSLFYELWGLTSILRDTRCRAGLRRCCAVVTRFGGWIGVT